MFLCSDCKDRERSWSFVGSSGHCDNVRCENYYSDVCESNSACGRSGRVGKGTVGSLLLSIPCVLIIGVKNYKKLTQPKITKFFKKE